jgi:hypothetical protein
MDQWLLLTDYASKYRVSVSTLRRRIKAGLQPHKFEAGRYFLPDHHDITSDVLTNSVKAAQPLRTNKISEDPVHVSQRPAAIGPVDDVMPKLEMKLSEEPLITTTTKLLNELKQAYTLILHEKEEQIIFLKEEIADLKTLVRVLESDNARLRDETVGTRPYSNN